MFGSSVLCPLIENTGSSKSPFVSCPQDKLQKDQRNAEVNLLKINDQWRTILRQTRGAELRGDVLVLSQTFEGHVDILDDIVEVRRSEISAKDGMGVPSAFSPLWMRTQKHPVTSHLQTLVRELSEAERQSAQVRKAHLQKVEELRTQQEEQLKLLQLLWDTNMLELISGFDRDRLVLAPQRPLLARTKAATLNRWFYN